MDWLNPVEWFAWMYGRLFQKHIYLGGALVVILCAAVGLFCWIRGVDKYREEHSEITSPKPQAVAVMNRSDLSAAAQQETPHTAISRPKPKPKRTTSTNPESSQSITVGPDRVNSVIENTGKMNGVHISGGRVVAPFDGRATYVRTLPGAETSDVTVQNPQILPSPVLPSAPTGKPFATYLGPAFGETYSNNVVCGQSSLIGSENNSGNWILSANSVNDPKMCQWVAFLTIVKQHRSDIADFMDKYDGVMERAWANIPTATRDQYRSELARIRKQLLDASSDEASFSSATETLWSSPPSFEIHGPITRK